MSMDSIEKTGPGDSSNQPSSVDEKAEAELEQLYLSHLVEANYRGVQLPVSFNPGQPLTEQPHSNVTPITTSTEREVSVSTETPVQPSLPGDIETTQVSDKKKKRRLSEDEPAKSLATVPEKRDDVMAIETEKEEVKIELKKLTAQDIKAMSERQANALKRSDVSHLTKQDLVAAKVPIGIRNILRPLFEPEHDKARASEDVKRKKTTSNLADFNAVKNDIRLADSYDKHYGGSSDAELKFTSFVDSMGYTCSSLARTVIRSSQVAAGQFCTFSDNTNYGQLFAVVIDLHSFFGDNRMRGATLRAGVFTKYIEVFHVGPGS